MLSLIGSLGLEHGFGAYSSPTRWPGLKRPSCPPHSFTPLAQLNTAKVVPGFACEHECEVRGVGANLLLPSVYP